MYGAISHQKFAIVSTETGGVNMEKNSQTLGTKDFILGEHAGTNKNVPNNRDVKVSINLNCNADSLREILSSVPTQKFTTSNLLNADGNIKQNSKVEIPAQIKKTKFRQQPGCSKVASLHKKQCKTDFDIEQFLKIIPDPVSFFANKARKHTYSEEALEFLKNLFPRIAVKDIKEKYNKNRYHLTLTAKSLDKIKIDNAMRTIRPIKAVPPPTDYTLLQEMTYLQHRKEIMKYISQTNKMMKKMMKVEIPDRRIESLLPKMDFGLCVEKSQRFRPMQTTDGAPTTFRNAFNPSPFEFNLSSFASNLLSFASRHSRPTFQTDVRRLM